MWRFAIGLICGFGLFFLLAIYGALKQAARIDEKNEALLRRMSELADEEMQEHAAIAKTSRAHKGSPEIRRGN